MSDNEHATAPLWNSEVLSVENAISEPIPEFPQPSEDGAKVPSAARRQDTGDVLPYQPTGASAISKAEIFERQVTTLVIQSASKPGDAERLAGGAADKKVNWSDIGCPYFSEVPEQRRLRIAVRQHGAREGFNLGIGGALPAKRFPRCRGGADAAAHVKVAHHDTGAWVFKLNC